MRRSACELRNRQACWFSVASPEPVETVGLVLAEQAVGVPFVAHTGSALRTDRWHGRTSSGACTLANSATDHRIRRNHRAVARPHRGHQPGDHRRPGGGHSGGRYRARQDPLGAHLRIQARRVRRLLRPQPGHRPPGGTRRSGRRDRGAVHRRARHPVDHAYLPHRWNRHPNQRAVHAGRQVRWIRALYRHRNGAQQDQRNHLHEPLGNYGGGGR